MIEPAQVALVLLQQGDKILLGKRINVALYNRLWCCPGGHIEAGESLSQALVRECQEELGITLGSQGSSRSYNRDNCVFHFVHCSQWRGDIENLEPEKCQQLAWFDRQQLPEQIPSVVLQAIEDLLPA